MLVHVKNKRRAGARVATSVRKTQHHPPRLERPKPRKHPGMDTASGACAIAPSTWGSRNAVAVSYTTDLRRFASSSRLAARFHQPDRPACVWRPSKHFWCNGGHSIENEPSKIKTSAPGSSRHKPIPLLRWIFFHLKHRGSNNRIQPFIEKANCVTPSTTRLISATTYSDLYATDDEEEERNPSTLNLVYPQACYLMLSNRRCHAPN
jgi:hypothetical protein